MKLFRLVLIVACFSIICVLFCGVGYALEQDEAVVSVMWSSQTLYQSSNVTATVFFASDSSEELTIYYLGLHFDWMAPDSFVGLNISNDPVTIPSYGSHTFNPMIIHIPEDASVGAHNYFVGVDGLQGESTSFFWDSQPRTLLIQDSEEEINNEGTRTESQQDQLLIIVGIIVVVVVVVLIIILMVRRKRKQTAPVDQPAEA